jgi:hypothetical protein
VAFSRGRSSKRLAKLMLAKEVVGWGAVVVVVRRTLDGWYYERISLVCEDNMHKEATTNIELYYILFRKRSDQNVLLNSLISHPMDGS